MKNHQGSTVDPSFESPSTEHEFMGLQHELPDHTACNSECGHGDIDIALKFSTNSVLSIVPPV